MNNRLKQLIDYKTNGKQKAFSELLGWQPSYLSKLLKGVDFGIKPVVAILQAMPEIDARWLLLGVGSMVSDNRTDIQSALLTRIYNAVELERFLLVMNPDEVERLRAYIVDGTEPNYTTEELTKFKRLLTDRNNIFETSLKLATV